MWDKKSLEEIEIIKDIEKIGPYYEIEEQEDQNVHEFIPPKSLLEYFFSESNLKANSRWRERIPPNVVISLTKRKFEEILEEKDPLRKIEILNTPCEFCNYYGGRHKKCIYYQRCKNRFENAEFRSPEEMDEFARDELDFLEKLEYTVRLIKDILDTSETEIKSCRELKEQIILKYNWPI